MLIKKASDILSSEITPRSVYLRRREFLARASVAGAGWLAGRALLDLVSPSQTVEAGTKLSVASKSPFSTNEKQTPYQDVTHYNNFYEFGVGKEEPAEKAKNLRTSPWSVSVEGGAKKRETFDLDALLKLAPLEERVYRHRCVEAWSIVVPWIGFPLNVLIKQVEPTSKAKYVAFQSLYDPRQMPAARYAGIPFPYVEGLRMDEAMHPLAILCFGMYGETLPNQDGAPVRLVVPWKYGFKSIKSIVKIKFVESEPPTTWNLANSREYGYYSNVNPNVDHPRWSQAKERRLGEFFRRPTLMFNGYGDQVAQLYAGMDLRKYF
ncbi:MAG: protein-methionine-sulfoxide reductase catalytic subunit MsrP [Acidobacteria bacterium]|nr:MAG: protein-methionine-sulfoxide reductase catalytic subunit MsrP [Acidobacteriota bacterium]